MNVTSIRNAGLLVVLAVCAATASLIWATSGHAAKATGSCPSVPAGSVVGYTAAGPVSSASGSTVARPVHRRLVHAKRHSAAPPGQMPPFITKHAADPACVPAPGAPTASGAPTPAP